MDCAYHPGKEAGAACVNCGKLICLECKMELAGKNYCPPCANEIFVVKKPAEVAEIPAGVARKPTKAARSAAPVAEGAPVAEESISRAWWLMPVFLTWVGGLVAWVVNKDKAPRRSRSMLVWGIVLTFVYPILWFGGFWVLALILGGVATVTLPW